MAATIDDVLAAETPGFARAVAAIVTGDAEALRRELAVDPALVTARSASPHRATLLHYVAANGIADELQRQVPNADKMAGILLEAGAAPDATCDLYGSAATTLDLLVSSDHPYVAGATAKVVRRLCAAGAAVDGPENDGSPLGTALFFGILGGVEALLACGARTDNPVFAAAAGDTGWLRRWLDGDAATGVAGPAFFPLSAERATAAEQALVFAAMCGEVAAMRLLIDRGVNVNASPPGSHWTATPLHTAAIQGQAEAIALLLASGADPAIRDARYSAPAAGWLGHARGPRKPFVPEVARLLAGGG